jgi:hypothetical protein
MMTVTIMVDLNWLAVIVIFLIAMNTGCAAPARTYYQVSAGDVFDGNWEDNGELTTYLEMGHEFRVLDNHWFGAAYKHASQPLSGAPYNDETGESRSSWIGLTWRGEFYD